MKMTICNSRKYFGDLDIPSDELEKNLPEDIQTELKKYTTSKLSLAYRILSKQTLRSMSDSATAKQFIYNFHRYKYPEIKLPFEKKFNKKQTDIMSLTENVLINAGPGTGKTTMLVELAYRLIKTSKKILYISFENKAIAEPKCRMLTYPNVNYKIKKWVSNEYDIVFSTIDSLACNIIDINDEMFNCHITNYDRFIRKAIDCLKTNKDSHNLKYIRLVTDIIIDEAQDIDDLRMELLFVLAEKYNMKLTICGDPKQRLNSKAGEWFKNMWIGVKPKFVKTNMFDNFLKKYLNRTYRFTNPALLDMINSLSINTRPELHVDLFKMKTNVNNIPYPTSVPCYLTNDNNENYQMNCLAEYLKELNDGGIKWGDMMICSVSKDSDNETSKYIQKFYAICNHTKIPCCNMDDGTSNYSRNGIKFYTSRGTKGTEADVVIVCGASAQNNYFKMTKDEAYSLNFVVCSRARKQLIFMAKEYCYEQPMGLDKKFLHFINSEPKELIQNISGPIKYFSVTDIVKERGFATFFEINKLNNTYVIKEDKFDNYKKITRPENIPKDLWGTLIHIALQICLSNELPIVLVKFLANDYKTVKNATFIFLKINGYIIDGRTIFDINHDGFTCAKNTMIMPNNDVNMPTNEEIERVRDIKKRFDMSGTKMLLNNDLKDIVQIVSWIQTGNMRARYDISFENNYGNIIKMCNNISKQIVKKFGKCKSIEDLVNFCGMVGRVDSVHMQNTIIEFKTSDSLKSEYQLLLYGMSESKTNSFDINPKMILINVTTGTINEIKIINPLRFKYCCDRFIKLHRHLKYINMNATIKLDDDLKKKNYYIVDTEYTPFSNEIFEITLMNLNEPYKTIVSLISVEHYKSAIEWLGKHDNNLILDKSYFDKNNTLSLEEIGQIVMKDAKIYDYDNTILLYYHSPIDIRWTSCVKHFACSAINLAKNAKILAETNGYFINPTIPKVTDLYNAFCINPIISNQFLTPHISLADTLMFYELFYMGYTNLIDPNNEYKIDKSDIVPNHEINIKSNADIEQIAKPNMEPLNELLEAKSNIEPLNGLPNAKPNMEPLNELPNAKPNMEPLNELPDTISNIEQPKTKPKKKINKNAIIAPSDELPKAKPKMKVIKQVNQVA